MWCGLLVFFFDLLCWLNIFSHPCALQMPDPEPLLLASAIHSSNGRSHRSVVLPRDLAFGLIKGYNNPLQISTSPPGLCTYLRLHFALRLPWFWYLWKETSGPSVLSSKEPLVSGRGWLFGLLRHGGGAVVLLAAHTACRKGWLPSPEKPGGTLVQAVG